MYAYRDTELDAFRKKNKDASQLMDFTFTLDCRIVGKIISLMDSLLAITDRQVIMMSGGSCDELESKYFPWV